MDSVLGCMVSDRIGPGALSHELAAAVSSLLGAAGGFAVASYSQAILCALDALGVAPGDAVVVSPLIPAEYGEVFRRRGIRVLLADVDPDTAIPSAQSFGGLLEKKPRAVFLHHTLGFLPEAESLREMGVPIVEDISQSLGGYCAEKPAVLTGDLILLSLDPENLITAGSGGLLLGRTRKDWKALRDFQEGSARSSCLADMNAALGLNQVREVNRFISQRREIGELFRQALSRSPHRTLAPKRDGEHAWFSFPVLLEHGLKDVRQYAQKKDIETCLAFSRSLIGQDAAGAETHPPDGVPAARSLLMKCLLFPLYPALGRRNIDTICKVLTTLP